LNDNPNPRLKRVAEALDDARRELIDISRRNRLLHTSRTGRRVHCLELADVDPDFAFAELAREGRTFAFSAEDESARIGEGRHSRSLPSLSTRVTPEVLERRLLKSFREARVIEEEQGVNILFLAIGFLKWFEDPR
jgi:hypothetical protein